jgi:ubiquinone/menaquinone biosynthesis C-methylase UbiE
MTVETRTGRTIQPAGQDLMAQDRRYLELLDPWPGSRILHLGCGDGRLTLRLAGTVGGYGRVVGADTQSEVLGLARGQLGDFRLARVVDYVRFDGQKLPFKAGAFGGALVTEALATAPDPAALIGEVRRVVSRGRRLVFVQTDWETAIYNGAEPAHSRRVLSALAGAVPGATLGRQLFGLAKRAGLTDMWAEVYVLYNTEFREPLYGHFLATKLVKEILVDSGRLPASDYEAWLAALQRAADAGEYFFSINRYICVATV